MRLTLTRFILLVMVIALGWSVWPYLRHTIDVVHLLRADMPVPLPVPVQGVRARQIADTWGGPRSGGRRHEGSDIFAKCGTPVLAATRGLVLRVGENRLGGNIIVVLGPGGYWHYYAHLAAYADVKRGDWIEAGRVIGYVGDTGNAKGTPCHLHYGIYTKSGAVNPWPFFVGR
ncbi:M23 family metallopeptidase [Uliginosibacterium sp. sgz301328]|uniref:M23 family metallopeptidase n=1 Tax=Uliginosibacterium sp. sgz301328 TaxID=3243764 RepID=UPI00359D1B43